MNLNSLFEARDDQFEEQPLERTPLYEQYRAYSIISNNQNKYKTRQNNATLRAKISDSWHNEFCLQNVDLAPLLLNENDIVARIWTTLLYWEKPISRPPIEPTWVHLTTACVALTELACIRHLHLFALPQFVEAREFPSIEDLEKCMHTHNIAWLSSQCFDKGIVGANKELVLAAQTWFSSKVEKFRQDMTATHHKRARLMDPIDSVLNAVQTAIRDRVTKEKDAVQQGFFWKAEAHSYIQRFPLLLTHILSDITGEHWLWSYHPHLELPSLDLSVYQKANDWLGLYLDKEHPDLLWRTICDLLMETALPIGARSWKMRTRPGKQMQAEKLRSDRLFQETMGTTAVRSLLSLFDSDQKLRDIAKAGQNHPLYSIIFAATWHMNMFQESNQAVQHEFFLEDHVITSSLLLTTRALTRMKNTDRPLIVNIIGKWCLCAKSAKRGEITWMTCKNLTDAVLQWIQYIRVHHQSLLLSEFDIGPMSSALGF